MRLREEILRKRVEDFQRLMKENAIDASMIRTLSPFTYFTGIKWLRPALLIPAEGEPTAFIFKYEAEEFMEKSWIRNVKTYIRVEELMRNVSGTIRESAYKRVGFDYSLERDSYVIFFELFKKLNAQAEIVDVHALIMQLRMIKDSTEIEAIRQASRIAEAGMQKAIDTIDIGKSELEIAAEAMAEIMRKGAENPHIYVTAGPKPRVHAEPRSWNKIKREDTIEVVISADYNGYYSNLTRTVFLGGLSGERRRAYEAFMKTHQMVEENLKPGIKLIEVQNMIGKLLKDEGYSDHYVIGFAHGVGLLPEEDPITTIVGPHRQYEVKEDMTLAAIHAPLTIPGIGTIKFEDTYLMKPEKPEKLTKFDYELVL
ncbi:MAG TPA: aminopeptidase P family protein [Candidatus Bathyarchaeota archaeon]|nr:aminopeptidase P family protein [Candidatus Bathyarchaeota archaeon]